MTLRIGFAGTGYINKIHAQSIKKLPNTEITAVINHRPESMAKFAQDFNIPRQYATIEECLADHVVDAIVVSTPNVLHAPQTIAALSAGVHVCVEKPMAMNSQEAAEMLQVSRQTGSILMVAHCWRFDEEVLWLKDHMQSGKLGKIIRTKSYGVHANWGPGGWFTQARLAGGGALADMGIHALDTTRFLIGDPNPVSVYARIGTCYGGYDVDDTGVIIVNWDNGVTSYIESGWWQPYTDGPEAATQLYGQHGLGEIYPTRLVLTDKAQEKVEQIESGFLHPRPVHCPQEMYDRQMSYFALCIRENKTPLPGGAEGLINMQIVDAAYESSSKGQVIEFA